MFSFNSGEIFESKASLKLRKSVLGGLYTTPKTMFFFLQTDKFQ